MTSLEGAQWLSGRVLDSRPRGRGFEPHPRHCDGSLSKNINPSLVLVQPRKTCPFITERLLMGRKEFKSNKQNDVTCPPACGCSIFVFPTGWYAVYEIEFSRMGKISGNFDLVCKNYCSVLKMIRLLGFKCLLIFQFGT